MCCIFEQQRRLRPDAHRLRSAAQSLFSGARHCALAFSEQKGTLGEAVFRNDSIRASCRHPFPPVLVVQTAQDRSAPNNLACRQMVPMLAERWRRFQGHRDARPKAHVWSAAIVVVRPQLEGAPEMPLTQRDEKVQTFAPCCAHETFTHRIRQGRSDGRSQDPDAHVCYCG